MKLRVLGRYENGARNINVYPGDEIEVSEALGEFLQNDAPGCFEDPTKPKAEQPAADEQPSEATKREAGTVLDEAQRLLTDAHDQAAQTRTIITAGNEPKPFDLPPDGTTLPTDATPPVITSPESGVEVTHHADEAEQQAVAEEQADEDDEEKGFDAPPHDKAVKRSPKQK